eukprot:gene32174-41711_t
MAHILEKLEGEAVDCVPIRRCLVSVSDKRGLVDLMQELLKSGNELEILSTGGTAKALRDAGFSVKDVSEYTQSPEILDGRVKTLHPKIHGGLLGVRGNAKHEVEMVANGIGKIDLVIMNLYPFADTVASHAHDFDMCIENIDIGGPSMLRSAAKNHKYVALAAAAFSLSARYDAKIAEYFEQQQQSPSAAYGCNPHQKPAAIYATIDDASSERKGRLPFEVLNGTPGYINLLDACNAWQLVKELKDALVNPASLSAVALAYIRARNADPMCSFGDFAAVSHKVDLATAMVLKNEVSDGLIAPDFDPDALAVLKAKKKGTFVVLKADECEKYPHVFIGDNVAPLSEAAQRDLTLASITVKYTQSNSVGYACAGQMVGVGAGQQSRVDCVKLAARKAAVYFLRQHPKVQGLKFRSTVKRQDRVNARVRYIEGDITPAEKPGWESCFETAPEEFPESEKAAFLSKLSGVALSSDAFFPFRDSIDHASKVGVSFIAQAGGSYGITMAFTDLRLFHH